MIGTMTLGEQAGSRQAQIPSQLDRLENSIELVRNAVHELNNRLDSVTRSCEKGDKQLDCKAEAMASCSMAASIKQQADNADQIASLLYDIIQRLEI